MSTKSRLISGRVPVTNAANVASDRYQYLDLSSAEPNLGTGNTGDVLIYDSIHPGGRKWVAQGDIRGSVGEAAYVEANTASANTLYLSGVDLTQNNRLTFVETNSQAAFNVANTKLSSSGGTITGSLNVSQDLAVTGNLTVIGASTTINTASFTVVDSLITLGVGNYTSDLLDIGISGHYNDGTNAHTGIIRDPVTKEWYLFEGYTPIVNANNNVNINDASFAKANVNADYFKGNVAFPDGTTQTTAATGIDSYARTTANTASENTIYTQGVDVTQNTNITNINSLAQAAFDKANNVSSNTVIIQGVDSEQNTRMSIIEGVDSAQNTRLSSIETVNTNQNTSITIIQGVDTWQNTQITNISSLAQGAFNKANSGARATASNTTPAGNTVGDLWLSLTDETLYIYSYDGVSNNWVDISGPILISSNILVQ